MSKSKAAADNSLKAMRQAIARQPLFKNLVIVDRVDASRSSLQKRVVVDFSGEQAERGGLHAHVRGIVILAKGVFTTSNTTNGAVSARIARAAAFKQFSLVDRDGHFHFQGLTAYDLIDDAWMRTGVLCPIGDFQHGVQAKGGTTITDDGLVANVGAAQANTVNIALWIPFASPRHRAGGAHNPFAGLIPLEFLAQRSDAFTFFIGDGSIAGAPSNVTFTKPQNYGGQDGIDILLDIVWLPGGLAVDNPWNLDRYQDKQKKNTLLHDDSRHEYLALRGHDDDAIGGTGTYVSRDLAAAHDGVTLTVGGETVFGGYSRTDLLNRELAAQYMDVFSATARMNAGQDLPVVASGKAQILSLIPFLGRTHAPAGKVTIDTVTRDADFSAYLHRTYKTHDDSDKGASRIARALDVVVKAHGGGHTVATDAHGNEIPHGKSDGTQPIIVKAA